MFVMIFSKPMKGGHLVDNYNLLLKISSKNLIKAVPARTIEFFEIFQTASNQWDHIPNPLKNVGTYYHN